MVKKAQKGTHKKGTIGTPAQNGFLKKIQLGIFCLGALLYANTLGHQYTQDDAIVIYDNMYTTQGIKGIPGLLT